jgi:arsenite oxidase small subunit
MKRRAFLKVGATPVHARAQAKPVVALREVQPWKPIPFTYPEDEPAVLLDVGKEVEQGVGPRRSILAFSALCQHMGCPVNLDERRRVLVCPCHASRFDPLLRGAAVAGPATMGLPRIALDVRDGTIWAVGVAEGLVYGRASNE